MKGITPKHTNGITAYEILAAEFGWSGSGA